MPICWSCFSWDAFATLITGALVVVGAVWVGLRQTKILERQVKLDELTLRKDLFEKRAAVFEATSNFMGFMLREADYPEPDLEIAYIHAMGQSRFLFPLAVHEGLDEIWRRTLDFRSLKREMTAKYSAEGHYGDGNPEREAEFHLWLYDRFTTLPDLFGNEMRLA